MTAHRVGLLRPAKSVLQNSAVAAQRPGTGSASLVSMELYRMGSTPAVASDIAAAYRGVSAVVAVAMAGSSTTEEADARSDLDLYVYATPPLAIRTRKAIATRFAT